MKKIVTSFAVMVLLMQFTAAEAKDYTYKVTVNNSQNIYGYCFVTLNNPKSSSLTFLACQTHGSQGSFPISFVATSMSVYCINSSAYVTGSVYYNFATLDTHKYMKTITCTISCKTYPQICLSASNYVLNCNLSEN
jgi:hypothetical protein